MRACAWQNQYQSVWMNQQNDIYDPKFWETAEECAEQCKALLADPELNLSIRSAGLRRVREMGVGNEDICRQILVSVL